MILLSFYQIAEKDNFNIVCKNCLNISKPISLLIRDFKGTLCHMRLYPCTAITHTQRQVLTLIIAKDEAL